MNLDRNSYTPLYAQIRQHLRIMVRQLHEEGKQEFPGDDELATRFGVSRMTVRHAIAELVQNGTLERVRGAGTFIKTPKITEQISPIGDFFVDWASQGKKVMVEVLELEERPCPPVEAAALDIKESDPVIYLRRRRLADETPVALDHRYFPTSIGRLLSRDALTRLSIHIIVAPQILSPIASGRIEMEAVRASREEARELTVPTSSPLLVRTVTILDASGRALWTGRSLYRGDLYRYRIQIPAHIGLMPTGEILALAAE